MIIIIFIVISTLIRPRPRLANQQALQKQSFGRPHNHLSPDDDDDDDNDDDNDDDDDENRSLEYCKVLYTSPHLEISNPIQPCPLTVLTVLHPSRTCYSL